MRSVRAFGKWRRHGMPRLKDWQHRHNSGRNHHCGRLGFRLSLEPATDQPQSILGIDPSHRASHSVCRVCFWIAGLFARSLQKRLEQVSLRDNRFYGGCTGVTTCGGRGVTVRSVVCVTRVGHAAKPTTWQAKRGAIASPHFLWAYESTAAILVPKGIRRRICLWPWNRFA